MNSLPTVLESIQTRTTPFEHPKSLNSTPKIPQFNTKNLSVQHPKPLSSTQLRGFWCWTEEFSVWNWGLCWTEGFWVLKRCGPCVELMCWTYGVRVELRGSHILFYEFESVLAQSDWQNQALRHRRYRSCHDERQKCRPIWVAEASKWYLQKKFEHFQWMYS